MICRHCNSSNTRVTTTEHHPKETWRFCRCLDCKQRFKTIEQYAKVKPGPAFGVPRRSTKNIKRGEDQHLSVLVEENIIEIRKLAAEGVVHKDIATVFGITRSHVSSIVRRHSWKHV
jgi:hypothetical protein